ncbi:endolytic transglycosylase MltG [Alteromonadaceae bacterium BrNp21-10]|nr:endolytic transglycosylase MltG [Alteromonadaceae bacterium BrNp21-10]
MNKRTLLLGFSLFLILILALIMWRQYQGFGIQPLANKAAFEIHIVKGSTAQSLLRQFAEQQLIVDVHWTKLWLKLNPHLASIKAGYYEISPQQSLVDTLQMMVAGKEKHFAIALVEGLTWRQWWQIMQQHEALDTLNTDINSIIVELNIEGGSLEGWLMPDTYQITQGTSAKELILQAYQNMQSYLEKAWEQRQPLLPYQEPYEALIMASIIEKETAVSAERPLIAGVFVNRLNTNMRLQTDPTVIYGMGESFNGNIKRADLRRPTPYNTYVIKGLPPTPIAMPGKLAIDAALHPQDTAALYFVARGDGSHQFSETLKQHNAAVRQYQLNR